MCILYALNDLDRTLRFLYFNTNHWRGLSEYYLRFDFEGLELDNWLFGLFKLDILFGLRLIRLDMNQFSILVLLCLLIIQGHFDFLDFE